MNTIMNIIKPNKLQKGDTIGIIAPAGCVDNEENAFRAKELFESLGYKVVFGKNIFKKNRYLAGTDEEKLEDLHSFFEDDTIKAIFCLRGGYGCIRLVNRIDYNLIRRNPKIFAGYSDITALCSMIFKKSSLVTYHAPMIQGDFGIESFSKSTLSNFLKICSTEGTVELKAKKVFKNGSARGVLFGGNLSTIVSLCGVDFIPSEKFIFFAEDLNEPVYKIDRMFSQLLNIDEFRQNLAGIVLGDFLKLDNQLWFDDLIEEYTKRLNIPVLSGFNITHKKNKLTIPIGEKAIIDDNIFSFKY